MWGRGIAKTLAGSLPEAQSTQFVDNSEPIIGEPVMAPSATELKKLEQRFAQVGNDAKELDAVRSVTDIPSDDGGITFGDL